MPELSKTAKASMVREPKKEVRVETPEEAIRQLRLNLEAGLYVTPDRIRMLLQVYDALDAAFTAEHEQVLKLTGDNITLSVELNREKGAVTILAEATKGLLKRAEAAEGQLATIITGCDTTTLKALDKIQMAEIPAQHEDEHHLIDFGHNTIHPQAEGGS